MGHVRIQYNVLHMHEELLQISPKKCMIDDLIFWPLLEALLSVCVGDHGFYLHLLPLVLPQYVNILECPLLREIHHIPTLYHKYFRQV